MLAKPGAKLVPMGGKGALAVAPDGTAAIALTLPRAPAGKTYEAWVMRNGSAERAGLFSGRDRLPDRAARHARLRRRASRSSAPAVSTSRPSKPLAATEEVS